MAKAIPTPYKAGQRFKTTIGNGLTLKIMAKADNYLMVRYLNGSSKPFVIFVKDMPGFLFRIGSQPITS